uniref:Putative metastriate ixostatin family member n=1 Tax=Rhipicephalus pulchellus TaxID=72859 RepID=L7M935_RHIPC
MAGWICLAFLAAIACCISADVNGKKWPDGCTEVTSTSFVNTSLLRLGPVCDAVNKKEHPSDVWVAFNFNRKNCTVCCAGKNRTSQDIYYALSKAPPTLCKKKSEKRKAPRH